jgi:hypothetical protein
MALPWLCRSPPVCAGDEHDPVSLEIIINSQSLAVRNNDGFLESLLWPAISNACSADALALCLVTVSSSLT